MISATYKMLDQVSSSASYASALFSLVRMNLYDLTASITGTCSGSIKLQKSDDDPLTFRSGTETWFDITGSSQNFTNATTLNWSASEIGFRFLRLYVTMGSGTSRVTATINAKGYG